MIDVTKFVNLYVRLIVEHDFDIIPVMSGKPGISKTAQLHQLCERMNWGLLPVHLALRPLESLSGIPEIIKNEEVLYTKWSLPEIVSQANELAKKYKKVILFFDDIHLADKSRQSYFFELATERAIQGHKLADNVKIICAGNTTTKAGAKTFLSAIINRFSFVEVDLDVKYWLAWAAGNKNHIENYYETNINPETLKNIKNKNIHNIIISLLSSKNELLKSEEDTKPFASPRSWYIMSEWLKLFEVIYGPINKWNSELINEDLFTIAHGTIGNNATSELITFIKYIYDVDFEKIVKDPNELLDINNVEKRIAILYSVYTSLGGKKYSKYIVKWLDFAYTILGNKGEALHYVTVLLNILNNQGYSIPRIINEFNSGKIEKSKNITGTDEIITILSKVSENVLG